jgi:hypothetical protein
MRFGDGLSAWGDAMAKPRDDRQKDLLRPALEDIIDLGHPLVRLAREIDWAFLEGRFTSVRAPGAGQPGLPTRLVAGLLILKHMHDLSDEALRARWLENFCYQFFCGELSFCHQLPFDRSSLTHWRQRLGEEQLIALIQKGLLVAHKTGALATCDLERVVVDTTVNEAKGESRTRPTPGCVTTPSRNWSIWRSAAACRCARAIGGWPSAPPSLVGRVDSGRSQCRRKSAQFDPSGPLRVASARRAVPCFLGHAKRSRSRAAPATPWLVTFVTPPPMLGSATRIGSGLGWRRPEREDRR